MDELYDDLVCLPGCDPTAGTEVSVALAQATHGIDFSLDPSGSFSGHVTDDATGMPLKSVNVRYYNSTGTLIGDDWTTSCGSYTTRYSWRELVTGTYYARTYGVSGYGDELYDDLDCAGGCDPLTGTPIVVTTGVETTGIDFALTDEIFSDGFESSTTTRWSVTAQ
jgi:hypothetical protein